MNTPATLAEYLVISRGQWDVDASRDDIQRAIDAFYAWHERLVGEGKMKVGQRLAREGKTVARHAITDGPFAEAKEVIGGYWLILASSLEEAAAIAAENPCLAYGLVYEIRPIEPVRASAFALTNETPGERHEASHQTPAEGKPIPTGSNAVFHVTDIEKSMAFYTSQLGFVVDFKFGQPVFYAGLSLGNVGLHLSSAYPYKNNTGHGHLYITFAEVDGLYQRLVQAGVLFYSPIGDRDYGMRDFAIQDPDANHIGIGSEIKRGA